MLFCLNCPGGEIRGTEFTPEVAVDRMKWYAVYTKSGQEDLVERRLSAASIEVLSPKCKKKMLLGGLLRPVVRPFFPCYVFARFDPEAHYRTIRYTRGVRKIVGSQGSPWPVGPDIIGIIRSRMDAEGLVTVRPDVKVGDRVEIMETTLKGLVGVFQREMKDRDRVMVLLSAIEYQAKIEIDKDFLKKL